VESTASTEEQLLVRIKELEKENDRLRSQNKSFETDEDTVTVPDDFKPIFDSAQKTVKEYFRELNFSPSQGTIEINDERYVLVRASALSYEFFKSITDLYADQGEEDAFRTGQNFLFDIAHVLGIEDAKQFHKKMNLVEPIEKLSAGPVHFAYSGWAYVEILPESRPVADENYFIKYNHPKSFEADSWIRNNHKSKHAVCIMNAAYSSGWCEESFGMPLTAVEITCRAKGDEHCTFIMAPPNKIKDYLDQELLSREESVEEYKIPKFFERKSIEENIRASLRGKEILLQEIHHRVKNNLQVIVSLLHLQMHNTDDKKVIDILTNSQNRVYAMGMVHEMLYETDDFDKIDFNKYVKRLTDTLLQGMVSGDKKIKVNYQISDIEFNIDTAIPLGLLLNELVTNSIKYAFSEVESGNIDIQIIKIDDKFLLVFKDNGTGMPDGFSFDEVESLGLSLVKSLVAQLQGELSLDLKTGVQYSLVFSELKGAGSI